MLKIYLRKARISSEGVSRTRGEGKKIDYLYGGRTDCDKLMAQGLLLES